MRYNFIEIGTSDFDTLIENCSNEYGLSVEPIKYYIDRLPNKPNVKKLQVAISDVDGYMDVYYISDDKIIEYNLPWWMRGSNSVNRPHPFAVKEIGEDLYNQLVTIEQVPTQRWKTLVKEQNIEGIDYLKVDTEGYDHVILNDYLDLCEQNPQLLADKIKFERHPEVSNIEEIDKLILRFKQYNIQMEGTDVILTKSKIPKIIHQTYKTSNLPVEIQKVVDGVKQMNPTFEYRFYDDNDCLEFIRDNYNNETLNLYLSINPVYGSARADFFRYLVIYKIGGVYLDIKSTTTRPLEETILPTDEYLLSHWEGLDWKEELNYPLGEFQNWYIISVPSHQMLKRVIETVKNNIRNYNGSIGKEAVLRLTGPIAYSKAIISAIDQYRTYNIDSPVREFKVSEEIGLTYMATQTHHHHIYQTGYDSSEPIILNKRLEKAYVLYATNSYIPTLQACIKSIKTFSEMPIIVYLFNSDEKIDGVMCVNWKCDIPEMEQQRYIDRGDYNIYKLLIERPMVVKDALLNYADTVAYVDSDCVATKYVNRMFDLYPGVNHPYFVEGVYDYLFVNERGGAETKEDLSTTLEHPACELFGIDQRVRERYRQTGFFVANQSCVDFLDEWYSMCTHPVVMQDHKWYAPYNEETIANVLLWKYNYLNGLPLMYVNASIDTLSDVLSSNRYGEHIGSWVRLPNNPENLLFIHGEKDPDNMNKMLNKLTSNYWDGFLWDNTYAGFKETIIKEIFEDNIYERLFEVEEGDVVFDIGASVGPFVYSILNKNPKHVFCFEPSYPEFKTLMLNVRQGPVTCINKGLTDKIGKCDFKFIFEDHNEAYSTTFKQVIEDYNLSKIDFLKTDCEGGEYDVFTEDNIPWIINNIKKVVGEWHLSNQDLKDKFRTFRDTYLSMFDNYKVFSIDGVDITWHIWSEEFIQYYTEIIIYIDNRK